MNNSAMFASMTCVSSYCFFGLHGLGIASAVFAVLFLLARLSEMKVLG